MRRLRFSLGRAVGALPRVLLTVGFCALLIAGAAGCGEGGGVAAGATVTAYVEVPLCVEAGRELARDGGRAGELRLRMVCLKSPGDGKRLDLATVGANARRATEDSAAVAYLEPPVTPSFSRPIVEAANIAVIRTSSGKAAMARLLTAVREADDSSSLREQVRQTLD
jgi:hypothetical protein